MKQHYFVKFDRRVNQVIGCQRATLILSTLEFWFSKKPDGFYKFIGPCSHPLYKREDSWTEELNCDPKSFTSSFKKIGVKYRSRTAFEKSEDKFQGKMYASFYDRYSNRVFFVRNDEEVNKFFARVHPSIKPTNSEGKPEEKAQPLPGNDFLKNLLRNGKNSRSYKEPKNSPLDLSKDKSHAGNEIIKKMIEIWTAIVQEGRGQIELKGKIVPFLRKALTDKFNNCLQKWKEYCISIARSKFLMGEKTPWKADLDWALKFESIRKVLSGNHYGIGDRVRKLTPEELEEREKELEEQKKAKELEQQQSLQALEEEIKNDSIEPDSIKNFRVKWLRSFGEGNYRELLADSEMKIGEKESDLIIQPKERMKAIKLEGHWNSEILSDQSFKRVQIYHCIPDLMGKPLIYDRWFGELEEAHVNEQANGKDMIPVEDFVESNDENLSAETKQLCASLKAYVPAKQYPGWLDGIKVHAIKPDGTLIVNFIDQLTVDYARKKFFQVILEAAMELWGEVTGLVIQDEPDNLEAFAENEPSEIDERTLMEQAIQSIMGAGLVGVGQGKLILNDGIPY